MKNWKENECCRESRKEGKKDTYIIELDIDFPFLSVRNVQKRKKYKFSEGG